MIIQFSPSVFWGQGFLRHPVLCFRSKVSPETSVQVSSSNSLWPILCVQFFVTPWTAVRQASLSITKAQSLLKLMAIKLVMPSNHLLLCHPLLLLPSIFPNIRVFSNGNPLQCSCLENPRDGGAWWAAIYGVAQSWTWSKRLSSMVYT